MFENYRRMTLLEEIEYYMNSKTAREVLRGKTDLEFSRYLAENIIKLFDKRIDSLLDKSSKYEWVNALMQVKDMLKK